MVTGLSLRRSPALTAGGDSGAGVQGPRGAAVWPGSGCWEHRLGTGQGWRRKELRAAVALTQPFWEKGGWAPAFAGSSGTLTHRLAFRAAGAYPMRVRKMHGVSCR